MGTYITKDFQVIQVSTPIYYFGDQANECGFFLVTKMEQTAKDQFKIILTEVPNPKRIWELLI